MAFRGGPTPCYPKVRPLTQVEEEGLVKPRPPEEDEEWLLLAASGGAGDVADTKEQQKARYETKVEYPKECYTGFAQHVFNTPDLLVSCGCDYTIRTFEVKNRYRQKQIFEGHFGMVQSVSQYRGTMLMSGADDCSVRLWKLGDEEFGEVIVTFYISKFPMKCVRGLPGQRMGIAGLDKLIRIVSVVTGRCLMRIMDHFVHGPDNSFMQSEGCGETTYLTHIKNNLMASCSDDSTVRFWDIDTGKCLHMEIGHFGYGRDIGEIGIGFKISEQFAGVWKVVNLGDDGKHVASCSFDRTISIWSCEDIDNIHREKTWSAGSNGVASVDAVGPEHLATCGGDKEFKIWNWKTQEQILSIHIWRGIPACAQYVAPNIVALAGGDASIRIINWNEDGTYKDLMGKCGFYAHGFSIEDIGGVYFSDCNPDAWTQNPIMYCLPEAKLKGEQDAYECIHQHRYVLQEALDYEDFDQ